MRSSNRSALLVPSFLAVLFGTGGSARAKLQVVATVPDLAAITMAVGGDRVEVTSLTLPTQDPHFVDARPHLALKLNRADLLLEVGLELEVGWLPVLLTGARNAAIQKGNDGNLDCSEVVQLKDVPRVKVDRSMGDIHPGGNPHYLVDPDNAIRVGRAVAARLGKLDPAGGATYQKNVGRFAEELSKARQRWQKDLAPYQGTLVVPYHKSWVYFTDTVGLKIVEHLEPKPGIPPSAQHVLRVIQTMRAQKVRLLLQEEYYPDRTAKLVADKTGAALLVLPGGTHLRQGETYLKRMEILVQQLLSALKAQKR
jgi:zinc/manganese transport system substrate-binding protein